VCQPRGRHPDCRGRSRGPSSQNAHTAGGCRGFRATAIRRVPGGRSRHEPSSTDFIRNPDGSRNGENVTTQESRSRSDLVEGGAGQLRPARRSRPAAAEAPAPLPRGVCPESQAPAGGHGARHRERRLATRGRNGRAWGRWSAPSGRFSRTCCFIQSGEPLEPTPVSPIRGPPTDWGELVQLHDNRDVFQAPDRRNTNARHSQPLSRAERGSLIGAMARRRGSGID
jgi:hypothetical protein